MIKRSTLPRDTAVKVSILLFAFLLTALSAPAAELIDIKGTIRDVHGVPVANAALIVQQSTLGTVSNLKGLFELNGVPENSTITVSHPDFEMLEITVRKAAKDYQLVLKGKPGWISQSRTSANNVLKNNGSDHEQETSGSTLTLERWPRFPGGSKELVKFLAHHMQYPQEAIKAGIEGQASVSFFLDEKGNISSPVIVNGPGWGIDEEAVRIVQQMPQWVPARQNGKPVAVRYTMVIPFDLEVQKLPIHIREKHPDIYARKSRLSVIKPIFWSKSVIKSFFDKSIDLSEKEAPKIEIHRYGVTGKAILPLPAIDLKYKK